MKRLTDEQNIAFMNDPRRVKAQKQLDKALKQIKEIGTLSAKTILMIMPHALKELDTAYNELIITEEEYQSALSNRRKNEEE